MIGGIVFLLLFFGLTFLKINADGSRLYPQADDVIAKNASDRKTFNESEKVILLVHSRRGEKVASKKGLEFLKAIHTDIDKMPEVNTAYLTSLANQIYKPYSTKFYIRSFLDSIPQDPGELQKLLNEISEFELAAGLYLSEDGLTAALYVPLNNPERKKEFIQKLNTWTKSKNQESYRLLLLGPAVAEATLGARIIEDFKTMIPVVLVVIIVLLFLFLGSIWTLIIIFLEVSFVLVGVFGLMGYLEIPVTLITTILPVLLISVAMADEIHLLNRILSRRGFTIEENHGKEQRQMIIIQSLKDIQKPIILTSCTTAVGFLSFLTSNTLPLQNFGVFAAVGILLAMLLTFTLIPAVLALLPISFYVGSQKSTKAKRVAIAQKISTSSISTLIILVLIALSLTPQIMKIKVQDSWISNFDGQSDLVLAESLYNEKFYGSYHVDIILKSESSFYGKEGILLIEDIINKLDSASLGSSLSYLTQLERVTLLSKKKLPVTNLKDSDFQQIIEISKLFKNRINIDNWITSGGNSSKIRLLVKNADYEKAILIIEQASEILHKKQQEAEFTFHLSGDLPTATRMVESIVSNQVKSIATTILIIFILLIIYIGFKLAFATILPILITVLLMLEMMSIANVPLGIATSMFTAITVGLSIDTSIYLVLGFRSELQRTANMKTASINVLQKDGKALLTTNFILSLSMAVLIASNLKANHHLGLMLSISILVGYLIALISIPSLIKKLTRASFESKA